MSKVESKEQGLLGIAIPTGCSSGNSGPGALGCQSSTAGSTPWDDLTQTEFDALYRRLYLRARGWGYSESEAEELVGDALVRLCMRDDVCGLEAWLYEQIYWRGVNLRKKQRRREGIIGPQVAFDPEQVGGNSIADPALHVDLLEALRRLPRRLRLVAEYWFWGHSHAEIAQMVGLPRRQVMCLWADARFELRELLAGY